MHLLLSFVLVFACGLIRMCVCKTLTYTRIYVLLFSQVCLLSSVIQNQIYIIDSEVSVDVKWLYYQYYQCIISIISVWTQWAINSLLMRAVNECIFFLLLFFLSRMSPKQKGTVVWLMSLAPYLRLWLVVALMALKYSQDGKNAYALLCFWLYVLCFFCLLILVWSLCLFERQGTQQLLCPTF